MMLDKDLLHPPRRGLEGVALEEERTWVHFYKQVWRDADLATQVLLELERDASLRRRHLGLFLSCQRCLRRHEHRLVRNQRVAWLAHAVCARVFVTAPQWLWGGVQQCAEVVMACLSGGHMGPRLRASVGGKTAPRSAARRTSRASRASSPPKAATRVEASPAD